MSLGGRIPWLLHFLFLSHPYLWDKEWAVQSGSSPHSREGSLPTQPYLWDKHPPYG